MAPQSTASSGVSASRLPTPLLWVVAGIYLLVLVMGVLWTSQGWGGTSATLAAADVCLLVGTLLAAGCGCIAARSAQGRVRRGWLMMVVGLLAWTAGNAVTVYYAVVGRAAEAPYPSWADAFYLLFLVCSGVAVALLADRGGGGSRVRLLLDGAIVAVSLFLIAWVGLFHGVVRDGGGSRLAVAVSVAYPLVDVVVIAMAWACAIVTYRLSMALLVGGLIIFALSNSAFATLDEAHRYIADNVIDLGWFVASGALALAALRSIGESTRTTTGPPAPLRVRLWLPYLPLVAAAFVILMHILPSLDSTLVAVATLALIMGVLARQFVAITENQHLLRDMGRLAFTDHLTGLASRALFLDRMGEAVLRQRQESTTLGLLCLDLDDFKTVNDELGHPAGDELLVRVAERLSVTVRTTDTVARFGGDEFAILIEGPVEDTVTVAQRILATFDDPIGVDGVMVKVKPSIGLTLATSDTAQTTVEGLLRQADLAMYAAKRDGGGCLRSFVPDLANPYELPPHSAGTRDTRKAIHPDGASKTAVLPAPEVDKLSRQSRWPPPGVRVALLAVAIGWVVFAVLCIVPGAVVPVENWLEPALLLVAAGVIGARSWLVANERLAWALIAIGLCAGGIAIAAYGLWPAATHFPSALDGLFIMAYPLVFAGLVLMVRQRLRSLPLAIRLDVLVATQTVAALATALAFGPIGIAATGSRASVVIGLVYSIGGLLLLALSAGSLAIFGWRTDARWILLVAGFVLSVVVNFRYLFEISHGTYVKGTWLDACFPGAYLLIAAAAWVPATRPGVRLTTGRAPAHLSVACAVVSLIIIGLANHHPVPVILSAATLTAIAARIVVAFRDVSALAESHHQAMTDPVTGIANRLAVATALTAATFDEPNTSRWDRRGAKLGIVLLSLDQFEEVATSLGRRVTDELLYRIAERLSDSIPTGDLIARVGDDQFAMLLKQADLSTTRAQAGAFMDVLRAPFALDHITVQVDARIGIALWPDHCDHPQDLLHCAEAAAAHARTTTSHIAVYDAAADADVFTDGQLVEELQRMLTPGADTSDTGELLCYYQPKIRYGDESVHSVEALVRWRHPVRGLLAPDHFLPAAEHAGLMRPVAAQVLDIALAQIRSWCDEGVALKVAVNLSATNLLDLGLVDTIATLLHKHDLPPEVLIVEITESTLTTDSQRARSTVAALRRLGARLSLDDYGTGWSSLARLQDLSVDELKLDKVFVARLARDPRSIAIVRSTVALAHSLGAELVAEGVEDESTLFALRQYGCTITQGHVHCPPLPADEFRHWIAVQSAQATESDSAPLDRQPSPVSHDPTELPPVRLPITTGRTDK